MARIVGRLTARQVANAKPPAQRRAVTLADGGNLFLQVSRTAHGGINRSWLFNFERDGKRRSLGLGPIATRGLASARAKARELRLQLLDGIDPLEQRRRVRMAAAAEKAKAVTFRQCAEMYLAAHADSWRNARHAAQWSSTLAAYAYPVIGNMAVADIDTDTVIKIIEPIWRSKPETASRVRGRVEMILGFATVRKFRSGDNPARWRGYLANLLPARGKVAAVKHFAAVDFKEMGVFMRELRSIDTVASAALQFTILTAVRTGECLGAVWSEVDFAEKVWSVPAPRTKRHREHRVPLSPAALAVLEKLPRHRGDGRIFPLDSDKMLRLLKRLRPGTTVHGMRSAFRDWAAETTNVAAAVCEAALSHSIGGESEQAYQRGDLLLKRRRLMDAWAAFCARAVRAGDNIVVMRAP